MFSAADLPDTIPLFPLPGALLLPRARLPLHIFEPRYLAMLDDTLKTSTRFIGMVQPLDGKDDLHRIGCAGRLTSFTETDDGRYMISLTGISRFRINREIGGFTPYIKAEVDWTEFTRDLGHSEDDSTFVRGPFMSMLQRYFEHQGLSTDWDAMKEAEDEMLINSLAMLCPFDPEDKQALLEAPSLTARRETLETLIEYALHGGSGEEVMQRPTNPTAVCWRP